MVEHLYGMWKALSLIPNRVKKEEEEKKEDMSEEEEEGEEKKEKEKEERWRKKRRKKSRKEEEKRRRDKTRRKIFPSTVVMLGPEPYWPDPGVPGSVPEADQGYRKMTTTMLSSPC